MLYLVLRYWKYDVNEEKQEKMCHDVKNVKIIGIFMLNIHGNDWMICMYVCMYGHICCQSLLPSILYNIPVYRDCLLCSNNLVMMFIMFNQLIVMFVGLC